MSVSPVSGGMTIYSTMRRSVYPPLASTERVVAEVALGSDSALLTDRRVIVTGRSIEQSLPLAHIALIQVRFVRTVREIVVGVILIVVAVALFAIASPMRTFFLNQSAALEPAASEERASGHTGQGLAQGMQRMLTGLAAVARAMPVLAWLLLAGGVAEIVLGVIGRTVVTFAAGGSEVNFARRGDNRELHAFVTEVGRQLPGPAGSSVHVPTVPLDSHR